MLTYPAWIHQVAAEHGQTAFELAASHTLRQIIELWARLRIDTIEREQRRHERKKRREAKQKQTERKAKGDPTG